jgi:hypothetical protein
MIPDNHRVRGPVMDGISKKGFRSGTFYGRRLARLRAGN